MSLIVARIRARIRDRRGYSLVELLVSMSIGMVVLIAVFALMDASWNAAAKVDDRVDVVARGRLGMELLTTELRSQVCLGPGYPSLTHADDNSLTFYADVANVAAGTIANKFTPDKRVLTFNPVAGTVIEQDYVTTSDPNLVAPPAFVWPASPTKTKTLLTNVAQSGSTPFFRYYKFTTPPPGTSVAPDLLVSAPAPTGLSTADMAAIVKIGVTFVQQPRKTRNTPVQTTFDNFVYVRTADPLDPDHSPLCI